MVLDWAVLCGVLDQNRSTFVLCLENHVPADHDDHGSFSTIDMKAVT